MSWSRFGPDIQVRLRQTKKKKYAQPFSIVIKQITQIFISICLEIFEVQSFKNSPGRDFHEVHLVFYLAPKSICEGFFRLFEVHLKITFLRNLRLSLKAQNWSKVLLQLFRYNQQDLNSYEQKWIKNPAILILLT